MTNTNTEQLEAPLTFNSDADRAEAIAEKFADVMTPGFEAEFSPIEADQAGAFHELALSEVDAKDSGIDLNAAPVLTDVVEA